MFVNYISGFIEHPPTDIAEKSKSFPSALQLFF